MRRIDLDEFFRQNCIDRMDGKTCEECKYHVLEVSCERLMEQPTIDAVEVVRCKDCKRWKDPRDYECPYHTSGDPHIDDDPEEDFFCKLGERREDDG